MTEHIKVRGIKPRIQYISNGILKKYEFPFVIFKTSDINVYLDDVLQDPSTYSVSEPKDSLGGFVLFETVPKKDVIITIIRKLSIERLTDFQPGSSLRADVLNDELDYQMACQQEIAERLNRTMILPAYSQNMDEALQLPLPNSGKAIVWNKEGTNLENSNVSINDLELTLNAYKTQAQTAAKTAIQQANISVTKALEATEAANQLTGFYSNCITKIPQDIKLSLTDGLLTIKAGSNFYYPNGKGDFKKVTTTSDILISVGTATGLRVLIPTVNERGSSFAILGAQNGLNLFSGSSQPSVSVQTAYWYDTANNLIKRSTDSGTSWSKIPGANICFPIYVANFNNGVCQSVEQEFNGVGYIGGCFFVLPELQLAIATGLNTDGTAKSKLHTIANISTFSVVQNREDSYLCVSSNGELTISSVISTGYTYYDNRKNLFYLNQVDVGGIYTPIGVFSVQNGLIEFNRQTVFHALDFNELKKSIATVEKYEKTDNTWCRVWSDGWIEQGGTETASSYTATGVVNFLHPFSATNYTITTSNSRASEYNSQGHFNLNNKQTTGFNWNLIATETNFVNVLNWYACGK